MRIKVALCFSSSARELPTASGMDRWLTLTGVTTGQSMAYSSSRADELTVVLESVGTTSGGTVVIEEAIFGPRTDYTGLWSAIQTIAASTFSGTAQQFFHISPPTAYAHYRVRISSNITGGGTVGAWLIQQGS